MQLIQNKVCFVVRLSSWTLFSQLQAVVSLETKQSLPRELWRKNVTLITQKYVVLYAVIKAKNLKELK